MKKIDRLVLVGFSFLLLLSQMIGCTRPNTPGTIVCGEGYKYTTENGCVIEDLLLCDPKCNTDQKCVKGADGKSQCVDRTPKDVGKTQCLAACEPDEKCEKGECVPLLPCKPACQRGYACKGGKCVLKKECVPPCPQFGYVCQAGECEKICVKPCKAGTTCVDGVCVIPCKTKCKSNEFCREGKCLVIEDSDKDGFKNTEDCNDKDKAINPDAEEICDKKDNNCDGQVDNILTKDCYTGPAGTLNIGTCTGGITSCDKDGKKICVNEVIPSKETKGTVCTNKLDDNCDGKIDNECP